VRHADTNGVLTSPDASAFSGEKESALLRAALDASFNAIVITDVKGCIEWVNPAFCDLTGYTATEAVASNSRDLLRSGRHDQAFYQNLWRTILSGQVWRGETINRRKDGSLYTEEQAITPVRDASGEIRHFVAVKQDITERKALEDRFRQAQKMEAIGQLAGGVAHDFNNLITAILGFTELITDGLTPEHPIRKDLQEIKNAGDRAVGLTRQLLAFSRHQVSDISVVELNHIVSKITPMLVRLVGERVTVRLHLTSDANLVAVDVGQIEQVIMNLAVNGRDAMPGGGSLVIETSIVDLDQEYARQHPLVSAGRYVLLTVTDTGVGIDQAIQDRMFDPFFTTKPEGKGTGLGLFTVLGIVKQAGGHIDVRSDLGAGTTFGIYVPLATGDATSAAAPAAPAPVAAGTETVLVAEDEQSIRIFTRAILERSGYQVIEAEDVLSAQAIGSGAARLDLLLTDMVMPGGTGVDLFRALSHGRPDLAVVYMSGYASGTLVESWAIGAEHAFIHKPFSSDVLLRAVRTALDQRSAALRELKAS
jgi:two-component system cell cycle sensor histidine kinase/response regulator CckA